MCVVSGESGYQHNVIFLSYFIFDGYSALRIAKAKKYM